MHMVPRFATGPLGVATLDRPQEVKNFNPPKFSAGFKIFSALVTKE